MLASRATPIGKPEDIYTCDRTVLRGVLMTGLDDIIHYSKVFKSYSTLPNGKGNNPLPLYKLPPQHSYLRSFRFFEISLLLVLIGI